jgi:hypothetical protein
MKLSLFVLASFAVANAAERTNAAERRLRKGDSKKSPKGDKKKSPKGDKKQNPKEEDVMEAETITGPFDACKPNGAARFPILGQDNSERLLLREGIIDAIPESLCSNEGGKNVILVVGDGMGW